MNLREPYLDLRNSKSWYVYLYSKLCNHNGQRVNETYLMNDRELLTVYRFHKKQNTFFSSNQYQFVVVFDQLSM